MLRHRHPEVKQLPWTHSVLLRGNAENERLSPALGATTSVQRDAAEAPEFEAHIAEASA